MNRPDHLPRFAAALLALGLLAALSPACDNKDSAAASSEEPGGAGGSGSGPCQAAPWKCGSGQACWITDQTGANFACVEASSAQKGAACTPVVGTKSPCGEGLACFAAASNPTMGTCLPYCDPADAARGCEAGSSCREARFISASNPGIRLCVPDAQGAGGARNDGPPCEDNPWGCPSGTTCWLTSQSATHFSCVAETLKANEGTACKAVVGEPAPCASGTACYAKGGNPDDGVCAAYCDMGADAVHTCKAGSTCKKVTFNNAAALQICVPD